MGVAETILDAVDILMDKKVSELQFNKTVRAKVAEVLDPSIGKYKVQYQNSYFTAYASDSSLRYQRGTEVYVEILSNDFEKNALIIGTVQKLGSNYIAIVEKLDRYAAVGAQLDYKNGISFKSYGGSQTKAISIANANWKIDDQTLDSTNTLARNITQAAAQADAIKIGVTVKNNLPSEQRTQGNFGIRIITQYYDTADVTRSTFVTRVYQFDINDMTGEPYKYVIPVKQYGIFNIDKENFYSITGIEAFCNNFPITKANQPDDIWFTDIHLQFLSEISENELQNSSLRIITPQGNFFTSSGQTKLLRADLRVKGKRVNYNSQNLDFYWFSEDVSITSASKYFSAYGGNGWKLLNTLSSGVYETQINSNNYPGAEIRFKCVAVFNDNGTRVSLSDILVFKRISGAAFQITSSAGTIFAFSTGKTVLTVSGSLNTDDKFQWARQIGSEPLEILSGETAKTLQVKIDAAAAPNIVYRCSIFTKSGVLRATPSITLYNNKEQNGCTLVIKDATQIFKYDMYGTSPASEATAAADRITIPALSFEIYDRQGSLIEIGDYTKAIDKIRWIWPAPYSTDSKAVYQTMLKPSAASPVTMIQKMNLTTGIAYPVFGLENKPTFIYGIRDVYNAELANTEKARNNIILEVDYQGEHLVASTDFTFTKEGELGTNGTKYYARITPAAGYDELYIRSGALRYIKDGKIPVNNILIDNNSYVPITNAFDAQLWDGGSAPIWKASTADDGSGTKVDWSIAKTTTRSGTPYLEFDRENLKNVKINKNGNIAKNILQATITYQDKKFYATYPIISTTADSDSFPYIQNGYREVMYESDGSRGKFNGLPFRAAWIDNTGIKSPSYPVSTSSWGKTDGFGTVKKVENTDYDYTIEPPSYFIGELTGHYIFLKLNDITTYLPIELYLNRYGMSAMNDWDGNSIKISDKNGGYILAPQIGAGKKVLVKDQSGQVIDNAFTGITIGETFQDTDKTSQIGMFGYYAGARSLFLDAETGDAEFGISSEGQIKIRASDGQGTISDGHYHYYHLASNEKVVYYNIQTNQIVDKPGDNVVEAIAIVDGSSITIKRDSDGNIVLAGKGMKIKFTSTPKDLSDPNDEQGPYIKYGTGNFMVDSSGHITARGGGKIAGWKINDTNLYSDNGKIYLDSYQPKIYGQLNSNSPHSTLTSTNPGFYLSSDGLSLGSRFWASDTGEVRVGQGAVNNTGKHWTITGDDNRSYIAYANANAVPAITSKDTNLNGSNASAYIGTDGIRLGTKFGVDNNGNVKMDNLYACGSGEVGGFKINGSQIYASNGNLTFNNSGSILGTNNGEKWKITTDGRAYFTDVIINNTTGVNNSFSWSNSNGQNIFKLTDTGSQIGGWSISNNQLSAGDKFYINSANVGSGNNAVISIGDALKLYGDGSIASGGGANFTGSGSIGGCGFGDGKFNCPSGVLYFGGEEVRLVDIRSLSRISLRTQEHNATIDLTVDIPDLDLSISGTDSRGGNISASGSAKGVSGVKVSGTVKYYELTGGTYYYNQGKVMANSNMGSEMPAEISINDG